MTYAAEQIGTTERYRIVRTIVTAKWLKKKDDDGTIIWGDPHVVAGETVWDFESSAAFMVTGILNAT